VDGQSKNIKVPATGDYGNFKALDMGVISIENAGEYTISFMPGQGIWNPVNLKDVVLTPVQQ
jgi:hypothetical protein